MNKRLSGVNFRLTWHPFCISTKNERHSSIVTRERRLDLGNDLPFCCLIHPMLFVPSLRWASNNDWIWCKSLMEFVMLIEIGEDQCSDEGRRLGLVGRWWDCTNLQKWRWNLLGVSAHGKIVDESDVKLKWNQRQRSLHQKNHDKRGRITPY